MSGGYQDIVICLIDTLCYKVNLVCRGKLPLHEAILKRNIQIAEILITREADVNMYYIYRSALQLACEIGDEDMTRLPLSNDANVLEPDVLELGQSLLHNECKIKATKIMQKYPEYKQYIVKMIEFILLV